MQADNWHPVLKQPELLEYILHVACKADTKYLLRDVYSRIRMNARHVFMCRRVCRTWKEVIDISIPIWRDCWEDQGALFAGICEFCALNIKRIASCHLAQIDPPQHVFARDSERILDNYADIMRVYANSGHGSIRTYSSVMEFYSSHTLGKWHQCCMCNHLIWLKSPYSHNISVPCKKELLCGVCMHMSMG